jgi:hypothetical protein
LGVGLMFAYQCVLYGTWQDFIGLMLSASSTE